MGTSRKWVSDPYIVSPVAPIINGPQREKMSLQTKFLISEKQVLFERVMFPKYKSFYLTGLFKVLREICHFYYMYPFNVIAKKNGATLAQYTSAF